VFKLLAIASAVLPGLCLSTSMTLAQDGGEVVDLQLVLAADVSRSMSDNEIQRQRDGFAAAFRDPDIIQAIVSGPSGRIAVAYFEWSEPYNQNVIVPWTIIDDAESAYRLATIFSEVGITRPAVVDGRTSISAALQFGEALFAGSGFSSDRMVIDISADGTNNAGPDLKPIRDEIVAAGIVINGLPIVNRDVGSAAYDSPEESHLATYFRHSVIGGVGSFLIPSTGTDTFFQSLRIKLATEIVGLPAPIPQHASLGSRQPSSAR
jgi:hypothetical protein